MTAQKNWRRALATATTGLLVASGLALAPVAANAAPGDGVVADATLSWGVKSSFRNYITSPIAKGKVTLLGATTGSGPYAWAGGTGTANLDGSGVDVAFGENDGVHFQGHAEGENYILDLAFTQPQIKVTSPTTAELYLDVDGREFVDTTTVGETYSLDDVHFADVTLPAPTVSGSTYTWTNATATMTEAGLDAFGGFYDASTAALDPITFTAPVSAVPATETTTSIAASASKVTQGDSVEFTATVAPAEAAGSVTFTNRTANGVGEISPAIPVANGVAKFSIDSLPVGSNAVEAKFTPADASAFAASATTTSATVTVEEQKVWAPKIDVFLEDGVTPVGDTRVSAGDKLVVKGQGFDPEANVGGRGMPIPNTLPQGTYVVFGEFAENWKPSAGAASTQRLSATQGWVLTEDTLNAIPTQYQGAVRGQWVELNADGSFEWTATLQDRDASKPAPVDGSYGVFTYAAGGVTNAAQEQEVRLNYGAPIVKTSTTLQADVESVRAGAEVTLTADVTPADQAGTVQFSNGSAALGEPVEVVDGVATLTTADLPLGANKITAEFVPANAADVIGSKSDAVTVTVAAQPAITIDGEKPAAVTVRQGEPIEFAGGPFTAGSEFEVWIDAAGAMQPVSLSSVAAEAAEDAVPLKVGDVTVDGSGMAAITWNVPADFAPGEYVVSFRGTNVEEYLDADFTVSQYVRSTTTLTSSAGVGGSPNGVEFVATIAPETATGEVTFTNNGVALATVPVANGTASATADLAVGSNEIVATFASSDATVSDSVSDALVITVTGSGSGAGGAADGGADGSGSAGTGANGGGTGAGTIDAVVTKPAAGAKGLASTGGAEFAGLLAGGALALLLGAGLMVARRRIAAN